MSDQPALTEAEIERIRSLHVEWTAKDGQGNPNGPTCSMCLNRWPCPMFAVLSTLDAERTLSQAAETALTEEQLALKAMAGKWMDEVAALQRALAESEKRLVEAERLCHLCKGTKRIRPAMFEDDVFIGHEPEQPCPNPIHPAPPPVEEAP